MIEVVFSESAGGSLKLAQHYGEGKYLGGCIGVLISHKDGSKPSRKEIKKAQKEAEEQNHSNWENAVPLGGEPSDIYCFGLALSYGDISECLPGIRRQQELNKLYSTYPEGVGKEIPHQLLQIANENLEEISLRVAKGEPLRVWYSNQPDEFCGLYWFMAWLQETLQMNKSVFLVKLPEWEYDDKQTMICKSGWGDVLPGEWHRYLSRQMPGLPAFVDGCAARWKQLQKENAPLRAVVNGRLASVPVSLYDELIEREIEAEPGQFYEAEVIGRVLGYGFGIGDAFLSLRIDEMVCNGKLEIVTHAPADRPVYHRILKNPKNFNE